jgi:hypothetical protein
MGPEPSVVLTSHVMYRYIHLINAKGCRPFPAHGRTRSPSGGTTASTPFVFSFPEGHALCRHILSTCFNYEPHDVQVEGVCKLCDGVDVFAILLTGMGKTRFLSMYMVMVLTILDEPFCPAAAKKFSNNPCMLVILPMKYLEHQIVNNYTECTLYRTDNGIVIYIIVHYGEFVVNRKW